MDNYHLNLLAFLRVALLDECAHILLHGSSGRTYARQLRFPWALLPRWGLLQCP